MSDDDNKKDYEVGYGKPPQSTRFGQPGGNPINRTGAPKQEDSMKRFSMNSFRNFIMNDAHKEVEILENGRRKTVPQFYLIISRLNNQAAKGNVAAARLAVKLLESAASGNDKDLFDWMIVWSELQERKLKASRDPGSLEHFDIMYQYYMFKRDMRRGEGVEDWPFEDEEPYDDVDWRMFMEYHDKLKENPKSIAPWPLDFPSNDPKNEQPEELAKTPPKEPKNEPPESPSKEAPDGTLEGLPKEPI